MRRPDETPTDTIIARVLGGLFVAACLALLGQTLARVDDNLDCFGDTE